ncbi:MAG: hydrolase [Pseudomonadota bacterium]
MLSGRRLDLLDPDPADIDLGDMAHGLARVARWNGQTHGAHAFSVAQHAVLVTDIMLLDAPDLSADDELAALLHDAPEYVVGDLISPFKAAIGHDYRTIEHRLLAAIHQRFGLSIAAGSTLARNIKAADTCAAYCEAVAVAGFSVSEADAIFGCPDGVARVQNAVAATLEPWSTHVAQEVFTDRCRRALDKSEGAQAP